MALEFQKSCKQAACKIHQDNKCLEGLDSSTCPHFFMEEIDNATIPTDIDTTQILSPATKDLFSGRQMSLEQTRQITYNSKATLVFILGEADSGKTTLLATIYDMFQLGYFSNYTFAGSLTQLGFEERCHLSRAVSGKSSPETQRSQFSDGFSFLHLAIKKASDLHKTPIHLLISDISGERIKNARDSSVDMAGLETVKLADHILLVIDGGKLAVNRLKHATIINSNTFILKALDNGIFNDRTELKIVISKWDLLEANTTFDFESLERELKKHISRLSKIEIYKVGARATPPNPNVEFGYGLSNLLDSCVNTSANVATEDTKHNLKTERYFSQYKFE